MVLAVILAAAIARPVLAAAAELVRLVLIAAVLAGLALAGVAAFVAYRVRQGRRSASLRVHQVPTVTQRPAGPLPAPQRSAAALPASQRPELHLHFHGVDADEVAAILRQQHLDG